MAAQLDPAIVKYIETSDIEDLGKLTKAVREKFGVLVNVQTVGNLLKGRERLAKLSDARDSAAGSLQDKVTLQERAIGELSDLAFSTAGLDVKERLLVLKELRAWVGQSIEVSGLYDEKTNALFKLEWQGSSEGA